MVTAIRTLRQYMKMVVSVEILFFLALLLSPTALVRFLFNTHEVMKRLPKIWDLHFHHQKQVIKGNVSLAPLAKKQVSTNQVFLTFWKPTRNILYLSGKKVHIKSRNRYSFSFCFACIWWTESSRIKCDEKKERDEATDFLLAFFGVVVP